MYKETTADRIEGGLSGTVNMNLRLPFDNKGLHIGFDIEANYGDFRKKWSPVGSLLVSDTWDTGIGRIGLLGAVSYSRLFSRADGVQVSNFQTRDGTLRHYSSNTAPALRSAATRCRPTPIRRASRRSIAPCGNPGSSLGPACYGAAPRRGAQRLRRLRPSMRYAPIGGQFRTPGFRPQAPRLSRARSSGRASTGARC